MPLSDREQQILQDIERQLFEQDPKFARDVATKTPAVAAARSIRQGALLLSVGFIVLVGALLQPSLLVPLGVLAFLLMLGGLTIIYNNIRKASEEKLRRAREQSIGSLFGRVEDKFKDFRRREER